MTPFGPLYGVTGGSKCPKNDQIKNLNGQSIETKLGGKVLVSYAYSWAISRFSWNFLITETTEYFFQILCLEILKHHIHISGKILSGNLLLHLLWGLVTPLTPRGVIEGSKP